MLPTFDNLPALTAALIERVAALEALLGARLETIEASIQAGRNIQLERRNHYTVKQVMDLYGVSKTTVYKWFHTGLQFEKMGGKTIINDRDLKKFEKETLKHYPCLLTS